MTVTDKIYNYFDKNPDLRVLFIFNDEFLAMELAEATMGKRKGYPLFPSGITAATEIFARAIPVA